MVVMNRTSVDMIMTAIKMTVTGIDVKFSEKYQHDRFRNFIGVDSEILSPPSSTSSGKPGVGHE